MHHKNIKVIVRKQLKTQFPNWKRLGHKVKQTLVKQVLAEVEATYDFSIPVTTSKEELLGIEEQASSAIPDIPSDPAFWGHEGIGFRKLFWSNRMTVQVVGHATANHRYWVINI